MLEDPLGLTLFPGSVAKIRRKVAMSSGCTSAEMRTERVKSNTSTGRWTHPSRSSVPRIDRCPPTLGQDRSAGSRRCRVPTSISAHLLAKLPQWSSLNARFRHNQGDHGIVRADAAGVLRHLVACKVRLDPDDASSGLVWTSFRSKPQHGVEAYLARPGINRVQMTRPVFGRMNDHSVRYGSVIPASASSTASCATEMRGTSMTPRLRTWE
jgi:hypothetical protein